MGMWPYGGLGNHRFPLVGSGDTAAAWSVLQYQIKMTTDAANVATHWTHDLGGFDPDQDMSGPRPRPAEMYVARFLHWGGLRHARLTKSKLAC